MSNGTPEENLKQIFRVFDINNDGLIDLIAGGHDWSWGQNPECEWWDCNNYDNAPVIIYGDGVDFINNEFQRLPPSGIDQQGIVTNFEFFDLVNPYFGCPWFGKRVALLLQDENLMTRIFLRTLSGDISRQFTTMGF